MTLRCPRPYAVTPILSLTLLPERTTLALYPFGKALTLGGLTCFLSSWHYLRPQPRLLYPRPGGLEVGFTFGGGGGTADLLAADLPVDLALLVDLEVLLPDQGFLLFLLELELVLVLGLDFFLNLEKKLLFFLLGAALDLLGF